jgi:hypothetical protein
MKKHPIIPTRKTVSSFCIPVTDTNWLDHVNSKALCCKVLWQQPSTFFRHISCVDRPSSVGLVVSVAIVLGLVVSVAIDLGIVLKIESIFEGNFQRARENPLFIQA